MSFKKSSKKCLFAKMQIQCLTFGVATSYRRLKDVFNLSSSNFLGTQADLVPR